MSACSQLQRGCWRMREYQSGFSDFFRRFVRYREASGKWNKGSDSILASFDRFCASHSPNRSIQNLMETWCARRDTESTNAHGNRIGVINGLVRYLNSRGLAELSEIEVPKAVPVSYIPPYFHPAGTPWLFCRLRCTGRERQITQIPN